MNEDKLGLTSTERHIQGEQRLIKDDKQAAERRKKMEQACAERFCGIDRLKAEVAIVEAYYG